MICHYLWFTIIRLATYKACKHISKHFAILSLTFLRNSDCWLILVMSVRLPVIFRFQCRIIAFLETFAFASLNNRTIKSTQICSAGCRYQRSVHHISWETSLVRNLDYNFWSAPWRLSDWFHCHFNPRYNCTVHCSQDRVMDLIIDASNDAINFFSYSISDIFSIMTCTIFTKFCTPEFFNRPSFIVLSLRLYTFFFSYTTIVHVTSIKQAFKDSFE